MTSAAHRAAAERLLSAASHHRSERDFTPYGMTPEVAALLVGRAQVHATLATTAGPGDAIEFSRLMDALAEGLRFGLTNEDRKIRRFAESLRDSIADAGFDLDPLMQGQSSWDGRGPFHATTCGVIIPLRWQMLDSNGVVWEHTGEWVYEREPVMGTADIQPCTKLRLGALLCTRGPLRSAKDGTPYTPADDENGFNPLGYPGTFDALAKTWTNHSAAYGKPGDVMDMTRSYANEQGEVWTWQGGFDEQSGEPELGGPRGPYPISTLTAFGDTLRAVEDVARDTDAKAGAS
jgi:hypothetical protein